MKSDQNSTFSIHHFSANYFLLYFLIWYHSLGSFHCFFDCFLFPKSLQSFKVQSLSSTYESQNPSNPYYFHPEESPLYNDLTCYYLLYFYQRNCLHNFGCKWWSSRIIPKIVTPKFKYLVLHVKFIEITFHFHYSSSQSPLLLMLLIIQMKKPC